MHINDEKLSAFLDQELTAQDMEEVREAIRLDATLTERLAQLASADAMVKRHAAAIDDVPMPASIIKMLDNSKPADVVYLSEWQKARQKVSQTLREHAALAASLALVIGLASGQLLNFSTDTGIDNNGGLWASLHSESHGGLQSALDTTLSGQRAALAADANFLPNLSFIDKQQRYCR